MQTYPIQSGREQRSTNFWNWGFIFCLLGLPAFGQDLARARKNMEVLCSDDFAGRGYLENGHQKAAELIQKSFSSLGLEVVQKSYFQTFSISQNLFPKNPKLILGNRELVPGKDYLPAPECPSVSGNFKIKKIDSLRPFPQEKGEKNTAWLMSDKALKQWLKSEYRIKGIPQMILEAEDKLTHSLSEDASDTPRILIKKGSLNPSDSVLEIKVTAKKSKIQTQNVVGMVKGTQKPDSILVVCAHYDHLGKLGNSTIFPGANDNASGTAFLLEMAAYFSKNPLPYSLVFIAFSAEEAGLLGSYYFVENPLVPLSKIRFVLNLDLLGFGDKGATVVNATIHEKEFQRLLEINKTKTYLPEIRARGKAANSDHYPFSEKGIPAFFLYSLGGPGFYHDIDDKPETVTFSAFQNTFGLLREFLEGFRK
jgi:aminopeptidase YwaD